MIGFKRDIFGINPSKGEREGENLCPRKKKGRKRRSPALYCRKEDILDHGLETHRFFLIQRKIEEC